jgi:SAM-dependent methyltransferase
MLTEEEQITIASYDRLARHWDRTHQDSDVFNLAFPKFKQFLPIGTILEIGSGGGRDAGKIRAGGYGYFGVDSSRGLLAQAKANNPRLGFSYQDIYNLHLPIKFDGFWCAATLIHLPKSRITEALASMHQVIRPEGIGYISLKEGDGDMVLEEEELGGERFTRHTTFYRQGEFADILTDNKFLVLESYRQPVSEKTTWLNYFVQT